MQTRIRLTVANPQNLKDSESQVYTNYNKFSVDRITEKLGKNCVVAPEIGNFPHMGGNNKPVVITEVVATLDEDNAGMDINSVIERYEDWGKK